jgi:ubiquinone/menaquinone biosynthesis C-methylase UbiE
VPLSHIWLSNFVKAGDNVVDATCGNGQDTVLLAELVGKTGKVWAFDIQQEAILKTYSLLENRGFAERVELVNCGHQHLVECIKVPVKAVVFNLGYLPGGDRNITTDACTTISALDQTVRLLAPSGIAAITVYPGHDAGADEASAVKNWATALDPQKFHPWLMGQMNVPVTAPYFILIQKGL